MNDWPITVADLIPHGYCLSWQPYLLWLHGVSDLVIALSYYSIPVALVIFAWRRRDLQFRWLFVMFGAFIMACGATHVMALWNLWFPDYLAAGLVKAFTAAVSVSTALLLYPLLPRALALPGPSQWAEVNGSLQREVAERREAEAEVRRLNAELEARVRERTALLEAANAELRAREQRLQRGQQLLQAVVDNSAAVIFVKDLEGRYLLINRRYAELFHVTNEAMVGRSDADLFGPELAATLRAADQEALAAGGGMEFEEVVPQDDGPHTYIALKFPLRDEAGEAYAVCGIATDITERQRDEERFRRVVEAAPYAMVLADAEGRMALVNARAEELFGYRREELLGQTVEMLVPERFRAGHPAHRRGFFAKASVRTLGEGRGLYGVGKEGREFPMELGLNPVETREGLMVLASIVDITARKEAEAERQARQAAEAANRAKSEFLANMSHELRTPLNAILGYAQIMKRDPALSERQAGAVETIRQSGQHLLTLINDLLDFAKIEAGKLELLPAPTDLPACLGLVADIVRLKGEEKGLVFVADIAPGLPSAVLADEKRLRQVLLNLLSNAVKFTDRGRVTLWVSALAEDEGGVRLRFEVADTGVGMSVEQVAMLFRPFEQVGELSRRAGGTGLGLAISRQLVRLMGGDIAVASEPGAGSAFRFDICLPVAAATAASPAVPPPAGYQGRRRRVLIVDDVAGNRAVLADLLAGLGFDLATAGDGGEAAALAREAMPDLVLMDLVMPGVDGLEGIRRIRATPGLEILPIIAVSASASRDEQEAGLAAGADAFLPKPIDQDRLLAALGNLLGLAWIPASAAAETAETGALLIPPREEMEILHRLALTGSMRAIRERASYLAALDERYRPFADTLKRLAQGYQSRAILALVEEHVEHQENP